MSSNEELQKKIEALQAKIDELLKEKVNLEVEIQSLRSELESWKTKYQSLRENVVRMGKNPETLSNEPPKPKTKVSTAPESSQKLSEKLGIDPGEATILAIEHDLIRRGRMNPGVSSSEE